MVTQQNSFVEKISQTPLDPDLHYRYAVFASEVNKPYLAYAELKTALFLGVTVKDVEKKAIVFREKLPNLVTMNHNQYYRFFSLASELFARAGSCNISVLDVGGGQGELAAFITDASYCLVEPNINGISGTNLPFPDCPFDYVVSCHVLEHIPADERTVFLDQLVSKARRGVILLNPFHIRGSHVRERLRLVEDITGYQWAKEHLECSLPLLEDVVNYASDRAMDISVKANGTLTTSLACVFLDYFSSKVINGQEDMEKINSFFNERCLTMLNSTEFPTAYLVYLGKK